ncbi:MAG: hypothetical protein FJX74_07670, partial [Armatimonadetes bacterium]|nr:hypothetical protein [Armatimonadota bacterium]
MTRRELNLAIFEKRTDQVLWQPRLETWIHHHAAEGTLPERYRGLDYWGIYDTLHCSVRYAASAGIEGYEEPADVIRTAEQQGDKYVETLTTPRGTITRVYQDIWEGEKLKNRRIHGWPVQTPADLKVLIDIVERTQYRANVEAFRAAEERMGTRGEPTVFLNSSGFTDLIKTWTGLPACYYLLTDAPDVVEAYLEACDRRDDRQIDAALELPCRIHNLGDHTTNEFTPPPILKKYCLPRWQRISERLHAANRFVHSHWDGNSRQILPYLKDSGLDSVESLTPEPQCDMTLEMIQEHTGDMTLLDLIPAIFFLPSYSTGFVLDFTKRVMDMFGGRLILGISDEISQVGQIEKVEA